MVRIDTKSNGFFNKKKVITFSILVVVLIIFIFLISKFFFDINFNVIFNLFQHSANENKLFSLWFILLLMFPIFNCFYRVLPYLYKLKRMKLNVEWYNWLIFCFITFFISAITPFAMGSEPYIIYWMRKRGVELKTATSIVACYTVIGPAIQIIITWPSFFILCSQYGSLADSLEWKIAFWAVLVGLMCDLLGTIFWSLMSFSKNMHYVFNLILNWFRKKLKLSYKSKEQIKHEFKENVIFKKLVITQLKDWKFVLMIAFGGVIWNVLYYCSVIFAFNLMDPGYGFNPGELFNYANVATTANNFIPIPGAEGTLQATLLIFIQGSYDKPIEKEVLSEITNNSVFIWRSITFYLLAILGMGAFLILIIKESYKKIIKKIKSNKNIKQKTFTIILLHDNNNFDHLISSIKSIVNIDYYYELVELIIVNQSAKFNKQQQLTIKDSTDELKYSVVNLSKNNNINQILNYLKQHRLIHNNYIKLLASGDYLDNEIIMNINNTLHTYDIYAYQIKTKSNKNKYFKLNVPFNFLYKKRIYDSLHMISPLISPFSVVFSKKLITKFNNKINDPSLFYISLIKQANSLRYLRKFGGYYFSDKIQKNATMQLIEMLAKTKYQDMLFTRINKVAKKQITKTNKIKFNNKFLLYFLPWYLRMIYYPIYNIKYRKNIRISK